MNSLIFLFLFTILIGKGFAQKIIQVPNSSETFIPLSMIANKVTVVPFSISEIGLGNITQVDVDKENIFISNVETNIVYRFDKEGNFINFIGSGEVKQDDGYNYVSCFCVDSVEQKVFLLTDNGLYLYNYEGSFVTKHTRIKGREIRLIGENLYVNSPQLYENNSIWRANKEINIYDKNDFNLRYNVTYSSFQTSPFLSVLRNRTSEFTFSDIGEKIYVYQPEFIGRLETVDNTVFSLSNNLLSPYLKLDFENNRSGKTSDIITKNIFLTQRYLFCEFERKTDDISNIFFYDLTTGLGITTSIGFWDDIKQTEDVTRLNPISTNESLFYFIKRQKDSSEENINLYLVELKK